MKSAGGSKIFCRIRQGGGVKMRRRFVIRWVRQRDADFVRRDHDADDHIDSAGWLACPSP